MRNVSMQQRTVCVWSYIAKTKTMQNYCKVYESHPMRQTMQHMVMNTHLYYILHKNILLNTKGNKWGTYQMILSQGKTTPIQICINNNLKWPNIVIFALHFNPLTLPTQKNPVFLLGMLKTSLVLLCPLPPPRPSPCFIQRKQALLQLDWLCKQRKYFLHLWEKKGTEWEKWHFIKS